MLQTIRRDAIYGLPLTLNSIHNKIKTYDEPVKTFDDLPLDNNNEGDVRVVLDENRLYIWNVEQTK